MKREHILAACLITLAIGITVEEASADGLISRAFKKWGTSQLEDWASKKLNLNRKDMEEFVDKLKEFKIDGQAIYRAWQQKDLSTLLKAIDLSWSTRRKIEHAINDYFNLGVHEESYIGSFFDKDDIKSKGREYIDSAKSHFTLNPLSWGWWMFTTSISFVYSLFKYTFSFIWTLVTSPIKSAWLFADLLGLAFLLSRKRNAPSTSPDSTEPTHVDVRVPDVQHLSIERFLSGFNNMGRMLFGDTVWGYFRSVFGIIPHDVTMKGKRFVSRSLIYGTVFTRTLLGGEDSTAYHYVQQFGHTLLEAFAWSLHVLSLTTRVRHYALLGLAVFVFGSMFSFFVPNLVLYPLKALVWRIGDIGFLYMAWSFMRWHNSRSKIQDKASHVEGDQHQAPILQSH